MGLRGAGTGARRAKPPSAGSVTRAIAVAAMTRRPSSTRRGTCAYEARRVPAPYGASAFSRGVSERRTRPKPSLALTGRQELLPHPRGARRAGTDKGEARGAAAWEGPPQERRGRRVLRARAGGRCPILRDDGTVHFIMPDQNESVSESNPVCTGGGSRRGGGELAERRPGGGGASEASLSTVTYIHSGQAK
jgi:hypothetical protein